MALTLISENKTEYIVDKTAFSLSPYLDSKYHNNEHRVDFSDIPNKVLEQLVTYLKIYSQKKYSVLPDYLKSNDLRSEIPDDDDYSIVNNLSHENLFYLIALSSKLQLTHLHRLACCAIGTFMKDKSTEEIMQEFTIECRITEEEAKQYHLDDDENGIIEINENVISEGVEKSEDEWKLQKEDIEKIPEEKESQLFEGKEAEELNVLIEKAESKEFKEENKNNGQHTDPQESIKEAEEVEINADFLNKKDQPEGYEEAFDVKDKDKDELDIINLEDIEDIIH